MVNHRENIKVKRSIQKIHVLIIMTPEIENEEIKQDCFLKYKNIFQD